jgi:hypothetical protein
MARRGFDLLFRPLPRCFLQVNISHETLGGP